MLDDSSIRIIATLVISIVFGAWFRRRSRGRLQLWTDDAAAARARTIRAATVSSGGVAYLATAVICFGIVGFVEGVVALMHAIP